MKKKQQVQFKPKKSVALSGVPAGNTALCTVGKTGNDLHYRGYDILDFAEKAEFEEIAYLLIYGKLPTSSELKRYKNKLNGLRGLPNNLKNILENIPANAHPMDVLRTGCSSLGVIIPEKEQQPLSEAQDIADKLLSHLVQYFCIGTIIHIMEKELRLKQMMIQLAHIFFIYFMEKNHHLNGKKLCIFH